MNNIEYLERLTISVKQYRLNCEESINRNQHMNELNGNCTINQDVIDAILVDLINHIAGEMCIDYGMYTKDLIDSDGISRIQWIEYVALHSYITIEEAEKIYPLCKSINMQREQAIALLQSKGDLELLYYTITREGMIS